MFRLMKPSSLPVAGFRLAMYLSALLPFIEVKYPPTSKWPLLLASVSTWPLALWAKPACTAPVLVLIAAMFVAGVFCIGGELPPAEAGGGAVGVIMIGGVATLHARAARRA